MSYDLSRKTFNPLDNYFGVVMQQGRVQLDADWNTMVAQFKRRVQAGTLDTFDDSVVPRQTPDAFLISGPVNAMQIGAGRIYVDGILAQNHTQPLRWDARLAELSGTAKLSGIDLGAAPSGPDGTTAYTAQLHYPYPTTPPAGESFLVYLDVWQRDVTWLQDTELVDVAVGVDTTAREQTLWQVKILEGIGDLDPSVEDIDIPGWLETVHPSSARLSTATGDLVDDDNPCLLPPQAGYKGLENQLYRVQVHDGGAQGPATFKWSRDNAVVATRVSAIPSGNEIVVESLGRDDVLGFHEGDWVEITDDHREFMGEPGELRRIQLGGGIDAATRRITLEGAALPTGPGEGEFPVDADGLTTGSRNTRVIRWDQAGIVYREDESEQTNLDLAGSSGAIDIPPAGTRLFLENGILVDFALEDVVDEAGFAPEFRSGDYWLFAARVNDSSLELLDRAPPMGIHHHYTKLAIVPGDGSFNDCRTLWPPEAGDGGCACTVCVEAESHNNGSATIQQAIDQVIAAGGGAVCLGIGEFFIERPVNISGNSVTLRGSGWGTVLMTRNPGMLLDIGGEEAVAYDVTVERLQGMTSIARGFGSAIAVSNVYGLQLRDCLISNRAVEDGTSQAIKFNGVAALVTLQRCYISAERGIVGPRLQDDYLATLDFSMRDCLLDCSQWGIQFGGASTHLGRFDIRDNHLGNAQEAGIELTGGVDRYAALNIEHNLFNQCANGVRSGVSMVRILHNDFEAERGERESGNAITFIPGLEPGPYQDVQVVGNRVRNYNGHAIAVGAQIGKMLAKQNQVTDITGSAFITEPGGSVEYLSLENNQFTDVAGVMPTVPGQFAAVFLEASLRADISNNILDGAVRDERTAEARAAIIIASSNDVRITGNRLIAVTPAAYTGFGAGIVISSTVGTFLVENNEIRRVPLTEDRAQEKLAEAGWVPLVIDGVGSSKPIGTVTERTRETVVFANNAMLPTAYAPVVGANQRIYAVTPTDMVDLGPAELAASNASVSGNQMDATSSNTGAVSMRMNEYCGFSDNEVTSTFAGTLVYVLGEHVSVNNNRISTRDNLDVMIIDTQRFVAVGNMTTGKINLIQNGSSGGLPAPWDALNILI